MKPFTRGLLLALAVILVVQFNIQPYAQAASGNKEWKDSGCESKIRIPWEEFKNLLKLDRNELVLTWEELNRLLQQTDPEFKPEYDLIDGKVLLSHDELIRMLNHFKPLPPETIDPVRAYLFTKSIYTGRMGKEDFTFTAEFVLTVLKERAYVKIPILSDSLALQSVTVNGRPALMVREGGYHCLIVDEQGEYKVRAAFFIKPDVNQGPQRLRFPIKECPITLVDVELPASDIEPEMLSAQYLEASVRKDKTLLKAVLAPGNYFDLQWKRKMVSVENTESAESAESVEKVPAMIYAEAYQLLSVEDESVRITQDIFYNILQSGVDSLRLAVSEGLTILSVLGPGVGEWREMKEGDERILYIPLDYERKGKFQLTVSAEKAFADMASMIEISGLKVLDTVNGFGEKGYIGVEMKTGAELVLKDSSGLEKVIVNNLPRRLFTQSSNPLLLGFKYLKHPFHLLLDIRKHEKVALPQATIDSARGVSFFTEDGLIINKVEYDVKNQLKQSLRLKLPEGAFLWSAVVGQESVEVRQDKDSIYIPLISSRRSDQKLESFPVEIIYYTESQEFALWGRKHVTMPQPDLTVSQILWSLYLPEKFIFYRFITNLEKEELASGLAPIFNRRKSKVTLPAKSPYGSTETSPGPEQTRRMQWYMSQREQPTFRNIDISGGSVSRQSLAECDFDNRLQQIEDTMIQGGTPIQAGVGVLPMNIQIPASGQLYRLAKNIVGDEQLEITVHYFQEILLEAATWLGLLFCILLIVWQMRRIQATFAFLAARITRLIRVSLAATRRFFYSQWSIPASGLLFLFSLAASHRIAAVICFLILWTAVMIRLDRRIRRYKGKIEAKFLMVFLLLLPGLAIWSHVPSAFCQQAMLKQESQVSMEWNELRKILKLDKDEIQLTWDEFQSIVSRIPEKRKPVYTLQKGLVTLSREQFDHLLGQMTVPRKEEIPAPLDYQITKASYKGKMSQDWTTITADFVLEVLNKQGHTLVPFLPSRLALQEVTIHDRPALLLSENGYHQLILEGPGSYQIHVVFFMRSSLKETQYQVSIPVQETSITLLEMEIPLKDLRVEVPQAQQVTISPGAESTNISAVFPPVKEIVIQWYGRKKVIPVKQPPVPAPVLSPFPAPVPAKVYAISYHLVSIEDDALKATMDIAYTILHASVDNLELLIPKELHIVSVEGQGVSKWRERKQDNNRILLINLDYAHKGSFQLTIEYEKTLIEPSNRFSFSTPEVLRAVKDSGYIGLELKSSVEVKVTRHEGLEKVAVPKLPQQIFARSIKPLIYGFRYSQHPHVLELDIQRHPKISVPMAVIDSANAVSFFTGDGKIVHRIMYEVRNQLKQFLKLQLPEQAELWSVFVGGKPAEPAREKDILYIPLIRSQEDSRRLKPFTVEVVYYQKAFPFSMYGQKSVFLPQIIDVIMSKVLWSLYLPKDYAFLHFQGNVEKERLISGIRPLMVCSFLGSKRPHHLSSDPLLDQAADKLQCADEEAPTIAKSDKDGVALREKEETEFKKFKASRKEMMKQQVMEKGFALAPQVEKRLEPKNPQGRISAGYDTAVMSIPISIPVSGQLYRFAKTAVRQEPLGITMTYAQDWIIRGAGWGIFLILMGGLFLLRKRLFGLRKYYQKLYHPLMVVSGQARLMLRKVCQATLTPLIFIGLIIAAMFTHHLLSASFIFLATLCLVIHQRSYWFAENPQKKRHQSFTGRELPEEPSPPEGAAEPEQDLKEETGEKPKQRKLWWNILLSLGIIIFFGLYALLSLCRYPYYRRIFLSGSLVILYYIGLFVWWLIYRIKGFTRPI
ncbi:MAG: hypothetical protein AB1847_12310 [bacterium]